MVFPTTITKKMETVVKMLLFALFLKFHCIILTYAIKCSFLMPFPSTVL